MYKLQNYMEDIVTKLTDKYMKEADMCQCEKCKLDVMAIALNELPTAYIVSSMGEIFAAIDSTYLQNQVNAELAILKAINMVKASPKH